MKHEHLIPSAFDVSTVSALPENEGRTAKIVGCGEPKMLAAAECVGEGRAYRGCEHYFLDGIRENGLSPP